MEKVARKNKSKSVKGQSRKNCPTVSNFIVVALAVICFSAPYFRGLFFDFDVLWFLIALGFVLGWIGLKRYREHGERVDLMDLGMILMVLWYIISLFGSVNKGGALLGTIRILGYGAMYYAMTRSLREMDIIWGAWLLAINGVLLTLIGIGSSIGVPPIPGSWVNPMGSTFQYRNAFSGYLLMVIPIAMTLYRDATKWWVRYLAAGVLYYNLLGMFGTQSRGGYIILGFVLLLSLLVFNKKDWAFLKVLFIALWTAMIDWTFVLQAGNMKSVTVLLWPFLGLILVWGMEWINHGIKGNIPQREYQALGALAIVGLLLIGSVVPNLRPLATQALSTEPEETVVERVQSIHLGDEHWRERLAFDSTAFRMALTKPILGFGANGWGAAYKSYQNYAYNSSEPHSEIFKRLVEVGFPGLIFYLLIWVGFFWRWFMSWRQSKTQWAYIFGVSGLGIFLHSFMDFDLSESAIFFTMIFIFSGMRILSSENLEGKNLQFNVPKRFVLISTSLASFVLVVGGFVLVMGLIYAEKGVQALNTKDYNSALIYNNKALRRNPYQAEVYADIAQIEVAQGNQTKDQDKINKAVSDMNTALTLNSTEPRLRSIAAKVFAQAGRYDLAYLEANKLVSLAGLYIDSYEQKALYNLTYAQTLIDRGNMNQASQILNEIIQIPSDISARLDKVSYQEMELWHSEPLRVSERLEFYIGASNALLGDWPSALSRLSSVPTDRDIAAEALLWKSTIEKLQGRPDYEKSLSSAEAMNPIIKNQDVFLEELLNKVIRHKGGD